MINLERFDEIQVKACFTFCARARPRCERDCRRRGFSDQWFFWPFRPNLAAKLPDLACSGLQSKAAAHRSTSGARNVA